jgi:hypothetical protein
MSVCLNLYYNIEKEIQYPPEIVKKDGFSYGVDYYSFEVGCGTRTPLATLLIIKEHLKKGGEPELLSKVKFISRSRGIHDPKVMFAVAVAIKEKLDQKGEDFINELGLEPGWFTFKATEWTVN